MRRPLPSSQRPLRLVQPYDDDGDNVSDLSSIAGLEERKAHYRTPSLDESLSSVGSTTHLESIRTAQGRGAAMRKEPALPRGTETSFSSLPLPGFASRERGEFDAKASSSVPRIREGSTADRLVSTPAVSSSGPLGRSTPSADRLAALYQQYQVPVLGVGAKDAPPQPVVRKGDAAHTPPTSAAVPPPTQIESTSTQPRQRESARRGEPHMAHPSRLYPLEASSSPKERSCVARPAETCPARQDHGSSNSTTVTLPPALAGAGVSGLMHTAVHVWAVLGFFEMRPREGLSGDDDDEDAATEADAQRGGGTSAGPRPSDSHDTETFLFAMQDFLDFYRKGVGTSPAGSLFALTALVRNGLWRVLFNAVFYCVTVLDARRRRRTTMSSREEEVRTGGPEDAYEVVFPSSSSVGSGGDGDDGAEREAPVRLAWRVPGESAAQRAARCSRDPIPTESPLWGPVAGKRMDGVQPSARDDGGSAKERAQSADGLYGGRLRTALPVSEWYFTLRCLAQVGYTRDAFYLQTPATASPTELLLALLWLTQQYKLLAVAEYVELNRRYGFLLQHHVEDAFWQVAPRQPETGDSAVQPSQLAQPSERLLRDFASAAAWPPVSFDESSAIQIRLLQLERCLGRSNPAATSPAPATQHRDPSPAAHEVRRLLAARRLISLALNRLHHALRRQAEQTLQLGLHSPLDAQLCCKAHHDRYEQAMAGLRYVHDTERRLKAAADGLARAGSLVAFLLRYEETVVPADEVLLALEEDDATWLDTPDGDTKNDRGWDGERSRTQRQAIKKTPAGASSERWRRAVKRGTLPHPEDSALPTSASAVVQALSTFRATHSRAALTETWKRLLRRSHVAPHTIPPENVRFLLDVEAQQIQEARVRENMHSRYSLQAALAAEMAVMGHEEQQQQQQQQSRRRHSRSPRRHTGGQDDSGVEESVHSQLQRATTTAHSVGVPPVRVALPAFDLVTNAAVTFAQLRAEEDAYGPVALGTAEVQLTEVGEPAAGSTTSARLELERLASLRAELATQLGVRTQTEERVAHCKAVLEDLYHQYGLRLATPTVRKKTGR